MIFRREACFGGRITSAEPMQLVPFQDADGSHDHILVLIRKLYTLPPSRHRQAFQEFYNGICFADHEPAPEYSSSNC